MRPFARTLARAHPARPPAPMDGVKRTPSPDVLAAWRGAAAVCFDVDSTLCVDESIDELAAFLGVGDAVAELTNKAMGGTTKFEDALAARLDLMQPSRAAVADFIAAHPPRLSPGVADLVARLHARGTRVFLVSGGFRAIIDPIADMLDIPRANVYANTILFDDEKNGSYAGFDRDEFTSRSGGKAAAVQAIRAGLDAGDAATVVAIGDGATDVEARVPGGADIFIGYGGTVVRPAVAAAADWFVMSMDELVAALDG